MSEVVEDIGTIETPKKLSMLKNRKQRRYEAKLARTTFLANRHPYYWVRRIVKEMKDNPTVIKNVLDGKLDKYLDIVTEE